MRGTALGTRPIVLHPSNWFFTTGANQNLSKSIGTYQNQTDKMRLAQINSDELRLPMSNNRSAPFRSAPCIYASSPDFPLLRRTNNPYSTPISPKEPPNSCAPSQRFLPM